ncbi:MAG: EF-hand domain-containing protein [Pseudomonadota bacterium]
MMKTAMLVSALAISAPALAQDQPAPGRQPMTTAPADAQTAPQTPPTAQTADPASTSTTAAQDAPIPGAPVTDTAPAEQATAPSPQTMPGTPPATQPAEQVAAAPTDPAAPVTGATQIAQVVNTEFPTYDKNSDTNLDKAEFGAWMVALRTASDPATKAGDPATVKWVDGAFASADTDRSKVVSKAELTAYLSQGAE